MTAEMLAGDWSAEGLAQMSLPELATGLAWIRGALVAGGAPQALELVPVLDQAIEACGNENKGDALRAVAQLFKHLAVMIEQAGLEADRQRRLQ